MTGRVLTSVRVDGQLIRVSTAGEGRPLLLITGLGGNIEMWDPSNAPSSGHIPAEPVAERIATFLGLSAQTSHAGS
jgi:hypothetical protein